jgi:glycyl-tRNA synthetase beta chain
MAELLLELFSEEIPARMQRQAVADLRRLVEARLKSAGVTPAGEPFEQATPRRLVYGVGQVPAGSADQTIERRGPRVDATERAREGFFKSLGTADYTLAEVEDKKGRFLVATFVEPGRPTADVLAEALPDILVQFPWPKSMRWGDGEARWVRPLQSILCLFDGEVVPFTFAGIASGRQTFGHRFLAPAAIEVRDFADYREQLAAARVMLDAAERRAVIERQSSALAEAAGYRLRPDPTLLDEIVGLVEWPVPLLGRIDEAFMAIPPEVLVSTMRTNQKYLALLTADDGLAPAFVTVANIEAPDGGAAIVAGNERVLRARLWDAKFFWDQDRKTPLEEFLPKLDAMVFHADLGTMREKVERLETLAVAIADRMDGTDRLLAERAARLAKADLVSGMVGEFPEVQGIMGGHYARAQGEADAVATAIAEHYQPLGPADACPRAPVSIAVALADKLDTLVGFFAAGIRPTGSKDPFALRRAALGVIRLITENGLRLDLGPVFEVALNAHGQRFAALDAAALARDLASFFVDRLKVQARERGVRHDLIEAVIARRPDGDLVRVLARVAALQDFLGTADGANLLAAYRRAANIVRIEEKKDGAVFSGPVDPARLVEPAEAALVDALGTTREAVHRQLAAEAFGEAMATLAALRASVDRFFDAVLVNVDDAALRFNRLRILTMLRDDMNTVADFSAVAIIGVMVAVETGSDTFRGAGIVSTKN